MKNKQEHNEIDYWDTLADAMLSLFLCILLIMLLFILYIVTAPPPNENVDEEEGDATEHYTTTEHHPDVANDLHHFDDPYPGTETYQQPQFSGGGGGEDGSGGDERIPDDEHTERDEYGDREDSSHPFEHGEKGEKSAVIVEVVDGETLLPLIRGGLKFELYDDSMRLQKLHDYYPKHVELSQFETTDHGTFYFPEKIPAGNYVLRSLSELEGYGLANDTSFTIDEYYDWDKPFLVQVPMLPLRSVIRIHLVDNDTGADVGGSTFQVIAAENIVTLDGTVRHQAGAVVDTFTVDANGIGKSKELYFGKYLVRQILIPEYYAALDRDISIALIQKTSDFPDSAELVKTQKTTMVVSVRDALYDHIPVPHATFSLNGGLYTEETIVSDSNGEIHLTNLQKNTRYRIKQVNSSSTYRIDTSEHSFSVDGRGMIQGSVHQNMSIENRMIRCSFAISGTILSNRVSDIHLALTDTHGNIIKQWTTTAQDEVITGLEPGSYLLIVNGNVDDPEDVYVADEASLQSFRYTRWTSIDTAIVGTATVLSVGVLLIIIITLRARKRHSTKGMDKK